MKYLLLLIILSLTNCISREECAADPKCRNRVIRNRTETYCSELAKEKYPTLYVTPNYVCYQADGSQRSLNGPECYVMDCGCVHVREKSGGLDGNFDNRLNYINQCLRENLTNNPEKFDPYLKDGL